MFKASRPKSCWKPSRVWPPRLGTRPLKCGQNASGLPAREAPGPEEILSKVCALGDQELYATTVKNMELQTMLANLTEGVLVTDSEGIISSANHFLCDLLASRKPNCKS